METASRGVGLGWGSHWALEIWAQGREFQWHPCWGLDQLQGLRAQGEMRAEGPSEPGAVTGSDLLVTTSSVPEASVLRTDGSRWVKSQHPPSRLG